MSVSQECCSPLMVDAATRSEVTDRATKPKLTGCFISTRTCLASVLLLLPTGLAVQLDPRDSHLLQPGLASAAPKEPSPPWPHTIRLRREMVPIKRGNRTVSHKSSFSGIMRIGTPAQEFNMVFDTGSAHIVVPAAACPSESCLKHRRYNVSESLSGLRVNADFSEVSKGFNGDTATIGFGSGHIVGPFVYDKICLGGVGTDGPCMKMGAITAMEMSEKPFLTSEFDGIFGLSFDAIAISEFFSFYKMLSRANAKLGTPDSHKAALQFGIFLTEADSTMDSELTLGGYNAERLLTPLTAVPVADPSSGHWMVEITGIKVGGIRLNMCTETDRCIGAVDSGSSHLGVPWDYHRQIMDLISGEGVEGTDCRYIEGLPLEIMLEGFTIELTPENYMRKIALPPDVKFRTMTGEAGAGIGDQHGPANKSQNITHVDNWNEPEPVYDDKVPWQCAPKVIPVKILDEMGKMFILGEPVLARYYALFDWSSSQISFSMNKRQQNQEAVLLQKQKEQRPAPEEDSLALSQQTCIVLHEE